MKSKTKRRECQYFAAWHDTLIVLHNLPSHGRVQIGVATDVLAAAGRSDGGSPAGSPAADERLVFSSRCGRVRLTNVTVVNAGIDWDCPDNVYWRHMVCPRSAGHVGLETKFIVDHVSSSQVDACDSLAACSVGLGVMTLLIRSHLRWCGLSSRDC